MSKVEENNNVYATFMETNADDHESWYTFIKYNGNEENIKYLKNQIEYVDWHCETEEDMYSAFDLESETLVSETTAKEMTKLNLNAFTMHRKFDGVLDKITLNIKPVPEDLKQKKKDLINDDNIRKVNRILSYGKICQFITDEDFSGEEDNGEDGETNDEEDYDSSSSSSSEDEKIVLPLKSLSLSSESKKEKVLD